MSRALERIAKITLPFLGSDRERQVNQSSHVWRVVDLEDRFGAKGIPKATECQRCKVLAESEASNWPCGQAPAALSVDEYVHMFNGRKDRKK